MSKPGPGRRPGPTLLALIVVGIAFAADKPPAATRAKLPFTISEGTTHITEPLRADGAPDYAAALEAAAREGVTPENNAAVLYIKAIGPGELAVEYRGPFFRSLGIEPVPDDGSYLIGYTAQSKAIADAADPAPTEAEKERLAKQFDEQTERAWSAPWSAEQLPLVAAWLERNEKPLELIVAGTKRPRCYVPLSSAANEGPLLLIANINPISFELRDAARLLTARAMLRLGEGKVAAAKADLLACHRLARHAAEGHFLVERIVGAAFENIACESDAAFATSGALSAEQALAYRAALEKLPPFPSTDQLFDRGERFTYLGAVLYVAMDAQKGKTEIYTQITDRTFPVAGIDWDIALRRGNELFDGMVAAGRAPKRAERRELSRKSTAKFLESLEDDAKRPWLAIGRKLLAGRSLREQTSDAIANVLLSILLPAQGALFDAQDRAQMRLDLARVALALAAYRAERGGFPPELDKLAPK
ncbi:MAG: hypothetical protein WD069_12515, partial [Planctomycetales bacterium]